MLSIPIGIAFGQLDINTMLKNKRMRMRWKFVRQKTKKQKNKKTKSHNLGSLPTGTSNKETN